MDSQREKRVDSVWTQDGTLDIYYGKSCWNFKKNNFDQRFDISNTGISSIFLFNLLDVNGDGKADISVIDNSKNACFFYGQSDSVRYRPNLVIQSDTAAGNYFGWPAIDIGDINGDGYRDFALLSSSGGPDVCINVYLGGPFPSKQSMAVRCRGGVFEYLALQNISPLGDINGDGINDFAASMPFDDLWGILPQDGYVVILSGDTTLVTSVSTPKKLIPTSDELKQNYPNPFNPSTTIYMRVPKGESFTLFIYNVLGERVRMLYAGRGNGDTQSIVWDGKNDTGVRVSSGVYFYQIRSNSFSATKKMLLIQ